jgi:hypothetical protein
MNAHEDQWPFCATRRATPEEESALSQLVEEAPAAVYHAMNLRMMREGYVVWIGRKPAK